MSGWFSKSEVIAKNQSGTWLSPIAQPRVDLEILPPPEDKRLRNYLGAAALAQPYLQQESELHRRLPPREARSHFPLFKDSMVSSSPLKPSRPVTEREIQFIPEEQGVTSGRFRFHEKVSLLHFSDLLCAIQIRAHTKTEVYHDLSRPVFCINLKSYGSPFLNLRLLAILSPELRFAEEATLRFSKASDADQGGVIVDATGRAWVDEQVIRRAAYRYSRFQLDRLSQPTLPPVTDEVRYAHFLVQRSHFPELRFDAQQGRFQIPSNSIKEAA